MKKLFVIFMMVLGAFSYAGNGHADCFQKISNDYQDDSRSFQVQDDVLEKDFEEQPLAYAKEALIHLLKNEIGCKENAISFNEKASADEVCNELIPGKPYSKVCYLESNLGYFFISMDMMDSVNIIFNRWD